MKLILTLTAALLVSSASADPLPAPDAMAFASCIAQHNHGNVEEGISLFYSLVRPGGDCHREYREFLSWTLANFDTGNPENMPEYGSSPHFLVGPGHYRDRSKISAPL
jgi:hypothetical protein